MAPTNYSVYPNAIDSTNELPTAIDDRTYVRAESVNRLRDAIFNIESELGVKPSTIYGTVRSRLDYIEANMGSGGGGGGNSGWQRTGTTVEVKTITDTVDFNNSNITSSGNPTWDTGVGNFTVGGLSDFQQMATFYELQISGPDLPAVGLFRVPTVYSQSIYTTGGDGYIIQTSADGNFYRLSLGDSTRTSYSSLDAVTGITFSISSIATMYLQAANITLYPSTLVWAGATAAPTIYQITDPGAVVGQTMTIHSQVDGTATARPTATDELIVLNATDYGSVNNSWNGKVHVMQSTDGEYTRVYIAQSAQPMGAWFFEKAKNPIATWTNPVFAMVIATSAVTSDPGGFAIASIFAAGVIKTIITISVVGRFTGEGFIAANSLIVQTMTFADEDSGEWPMQSLGIYISTVGHRGRKGEMFDFWLGSVTRSSSDDYPADSSRQFAQFGDAILPWGGNAALQMT